MWTVRRGRGSAVSVCLDLDWGSGGGVERVGRASDRWRTAPLLNNASNSISRGGAEAQSTELGVYQGNQGV